MQKAIEDIVELDNAILIEVQTNLEKAATVHSAIGTDLFEMTEPNIENFKLNYEFYVNLFNIMGDYHNAIEKALPKLHEQADKLKTYLTSKEKSYALLNCANS